MAIKRGLGFDEQGSLRRLEILEPVAVDALESVPGHHEASVPPVASGMANVLAATYEEGGHRAASCRTFVVSLASYIHDGHSSAGQSPGLYSDLSRFSENLRGWLSAEITSRVGASSTVDLLHDGTAAAAAFAGQDKASAVILLGTALGVGFPPKESAIPIASDFRLVSSPSKNNLPRMQNGQVES